MNSHLNLSQDSANSTAHKGSYSNNTEEEGDIHPESWNADSEEKSPLHGWIEMEQEDKARTWKEHGMPKENGKFPVFFGSGPEATIARGIIAEMEAEGNESLEEIQKMFPEVHAAKSLALQKSDPKLDGTYPLRYITAAQFINAHSAICFANGYGLPMCTHVTINLTQLGLRTYKELYDLFFKPLLGWEKYHQQEKMLEKYGMHPEDFPCLPYVAVREKSDHTGDHVHILLGIPPILCNTFRKWFGKFKKRVLKERNAPDTAIHMEDRLTPDIKTQWDVFQYIFKGLDPTLMIMIPSDDLPRPLTNLIAAKPIASGSFPPDVELVSIAKCIDAPARAKQGVKYPMEEGRFDIRELYTSCWYEEGCRETQEIKDRDRWLKEHAQIAEALANITI